jgi:hypothetical protein
MRLCTSALTSVSSRRGFGVGAAGPSGIMISLRPPRRCSRIGMRIVRVSSCGPVCSVTVTDRLAMQIGLSLVVAALAGIAGYIGGRLEAALAPGTASRLAGPGKGARRTAAANSAVERHRRWTRRRLTAWRDRGSWRCSCCRPARGPDRGPPCRAAPAGPLLEEDGSAGRQESGHMLNQPPGTSVRSRKCIGKRACGYPCSGRG